MSLLADTASSFVRMHATRLTTVALALVFAAILSPAASAGLPTIILTTSRQAVLNDGRDSVEIMAEVRESSGQYAADGTTVSFSTNLGTFMGAGVTAQAQTRAGTARVRMMGEQKGMAVVTAATSNGGFQKLEILFTDDPAETFQGNAFVTVQGSGSLIYCAAERTIEATSRPAADGKPERPGAYLHFRSVEVTASRLQVDCSANTVRASGEVTVRRGSKRLLCRRLNYSLTNGKGWAVVETERSLRPVKIVSMDLGTEPADDGVASLLFEMRDLADAALVVVARQVLFFPGEKLQFKRPRFYQDGGHVFSLPFYSLPLYSNQLFTDQMLSVGSQGVGVDVPLYYDLSPSSKGIFRVRYGEQNGRSMMARRPGWSMDLTQAYNSVGSQRRHTGEFGLTGLNRSDWGFRWTHSQELASDTRTSIYVDTPQHRSLFGSVNLSHGFGGLRTGLHLTGSNSLTGAKTNGYSGDVYVETTPRRFGRTGYMVAFGGNASMNRSRIGEIQTRGVSEGINARLFSKPFKLDSETTLTNTLSFGRIWTDMGSGGYSAVGSLSVARNFKSGGSLQVGYDYARQPSALTQGGSHRLTASYGLYNNRWSAYLYSTYMLDAANSNLIGDLAYAFAPRWRLSLTATLQTFGAAGYRDYEVGLARDIGGRDLFLSYSTYNHRIMFDLQASRF